MEISFKCEHCGHAGTIDEACAGLLMKCVHCTDVVTIPVPRGVASATEFLKEQQQSDPAAPQSVCPFCLESNPFGSVHCQVCGHTLLRPAGPTKARRRLGLSFAIGSLAVALITGLVWFLFLTGQRSVQVADAQPPTPHYAATPSLPEISRKPEPPPPAREPPRRAAVVAPLPASEPTQALPPAILGEALRAIRQVSDLNTATKDKANLDYAVYAEKVSDLAKVVDDFLRVVDESGAFDSSSELREMCKRMSDAFFDHNLALNHWNVERSLRADKDAVKRAYQSRAEEAASKPEAERALTDATEELDELTYRVMRAINDRYDLWIDAEQQEEALQTIMARVSK